MKERLLVDILEKQAYEMDLGMIDLVRYASL